MNWREKLADWFTGWELSEAWKCQSFWHDKYREAEGNLTKAEMLGVKYQACLEEIAVIPVTPESNGTLRKAVRIAKEALK